MNLIRQASLLVLILLQSFLPARAQDDIIHSFDTSLPKTIWTSTLPLTIAQKTIYYDDEKVNFLFGLFSALPQSRLQDCKVRVLGPASFVLCTFYHGNSLRFPVCDRSAQQVDILTYVSFVSCLADSNFAISANANTIGMYHCTAKNIAVRSALVTNLNFTGNIIDHSIAISDTRASKISISGNRFGAANSSHQFVGIQQSKIDYLTILDNVVPIKWINFSTDTFNSGIHIRDTTTSTGSLPPHREYDFTSCHINSFVTIEPARETRKIKLNFTACTFGDAASLRNLALDTIEFRNCIHINTPIPLSVMNTKEPVYLKLFNTSVANIDFDYLGRIKLFLWKDNDQLNRTNYENLIAKFENEKKTESLKNIRIEYYQYSNNDVLCFLNAIWWYYGYHKEFILIWTAIFLAIFYFINFKTWEKIQPIYPIFEEDTPASPEIPEKPRIIRKRKRVTVLAFTAMIFFSLKIDFQKLSFKNPNLVIYFFVQYLVGLGCLFFILNAILKF
jgi:hypothetical protein